MLARQRSLRPNLARIVGSISMLVALGCGGTPAPKGPDPSPPQTTPADRRDARARLVHALSDLPTAKPVLGALDSRQRAEFDRILASLSGAEVEQLRAADSPMAQARPLLHLMAGGESPNALLTLATSPRASEELLQTAEPVDFEAVLAATNEVVRRAALAWLVHARETLEAETVDVPFCEALDQVLAVLELYPVRQVSRELWLEIDPSAAAQLNVAQALLWTGDFGAAEAAYGKAKDAASSQPDLAPFVERLGERIERAKRLATPAPDLDGRVEQARTYLELGDSASARRLLDADLPRAAQHLGLAVALLRAHFPNLPCTGITGGLGHPALCAFVQQSVLFPSPEFANLEGAFKSGAGRSPESLQDYLGLAFILSWKAESSLTGRVDVAARAGALAKAAGSLADQGPDFAAVSLFAAALEASARAVASAPPGHAAQIDEPQAVALEERALALGASERPPTRTRAALLAVAAVLSQQRDIRKLLDRGSGEDLMLSLTEAALGVWAAATWGDSKRYERAQGLSMEVLTRVNPQSMARSELVLLLAESEFALNPSEANLKALEAISRKLSSPDLPAELSLRAALDHSASLEKLGDIAQAARTLHAVLDGLPSRDLARVRGLVALARARLALLLPPETKQADRLRVFDAAFEDEGLSSSLLAWRDAWRSKLAPGQPRNVKSRKVERRMGPVQARLAARDLLTVGALELSLDYYPELGIVPRVQVEPQLLLVPFP